MNIEKGSVVTLKSGGPKMTVKVVSVDIFDCQWFIGDKRFEELRVGSFSPESLVLVKDENCERSPLAD